MDREKGGKKRQKHDVQLTREQITSQSKTKRLRLSDSGKNSKVQYSTVQSTAPQ